MSAVDAERLQARVRQVCAVMSSHAGGIELVGVSAGGVVELRFTGMCQGCHFRPLTMHGTIVPALMAVPGVTAVRAPGARISEEAEERLRAALGSWLPPLPAVRADG
jgi:Fe-S cluster biogenesis protein NfuA